MPFPPSSAGPSHVAPIWVLFVVVGSESGAVEGVEGTDARIALRSEFETLPTELVANSLNLKSSPT